MREIKFRSYVKRFNGKIESIIWCPFNEITCPPDFNVPVKGDLLAYGLQFTGLKDKNGKEIYEGDVVRFKVDFPDQEFDNGVVRWADGGYWTSQTEDDLEELLSEELSDLPGEVIGNIYENPELVTPK